MRFLWLAAATLLLIGCGGNSSQINVLHNSYAELKNDGVADNCANWQELVNAVPEGSTLKFPVGRYYISQSCSPFGFVLSKRLNVAGESRGYLDNSEIQGGAVLLAPLQMNLIAGIHVTNIATDCRHWSGECDGISSGAPSTAAGNAVVSNYLYIGTGMNDPAHAVLFQSGPGNLVEHINVHDAFHGLAIRSSQTTARDVYLVNSYDVVVKSATGSGPVESVKLSQIDCEASILPGGCIVAMNAYDGLAISSVSFTDISCRDSVYCFVLYSENGGSINGVTVSRLGGYNLNTGIYAYTNSGGPIAATFDDVCFTSLSGQLLNNPASANITISRTCN